MNEPANLQHTAQDCPLVRARIACLPCGYGYSEARFSDYQEYFEYWVEEDAKA